MLLVLGLGFLENPLRNCKEKPAAEGLSLVLCVDTCNRMDLLTACVLLLFEARFLHIFLYNLYILSEFPSFLACGRDPLRCDCVTLRGLVAKTLYFRLF